MKVSSLSTSKLEPVENSAAVAHTAVVIKERIVHRQIAAAGNGTGGRVDNAGRDHGGGAMVDCKSRASTGGIDEDRFRARGNGDDAGAGCQLQRSLLQSDGAARQA